MTEAGSPQELYAYLDEEVLRRLWALLRLPPSSAARGSRGSQSWPTYLLADQPVLLAPAAGAVDR